MDTSTPFTRPPDRSAPSVESLALKALTKEFDDFITACLKADGPSQSDIAKARGFIPAGYVNSYQK